MQNEDLLRWIEVLREARYEPGRTPLTLMLGPLEELLRQTPGMFPSEAVESLAAFGRFTKAMLDRSIDDVFQPLARNGLNRWIAAELGSVQVLDRPAEGARGVLRRARGPEWMLQIYAGNVPTLPVWPIYSALVLKAALLGKTSAREPLFAPVLARTIAEVDEKLGACLAIVWWKGEPAASTAPRSAAPAVLAFGGEEAVGSVARQAMPGATVVLHGPKVSVGYIERRALTFAGIRGLAERAAHDVSMYDQDGCLSPHASAERRAGVAGEVRRSAGRRARGASKDLPATVAEEGGCRERSAHRAQARFESAGIATVTRVSNHPGRRHGPSSWTIAPASSRTHLRTVRVHAVDGRTRSRGSRRRREPSKRWDWRRRSGEGPAAAAFADLEFADRPGRLAPESGPWGTHGGVPRLLPFVTWATVEQSGVSASPARTPGTARRKARAPGLRRR